MTTKLSSIIIVIASTFLTSTAQLMYKFGMNTLSFDIYNIITNYFLIIGVILYMSAMVMLIIALKWGELSVLFPIYATSYVWVNILAFYFLNEHMNIFKWSGITLIILGIIFVGRDNK